MKTFFLRVNQFPVGFRLEFNKGDINTVNTGSSHHTGYDHGENFLSDLSLLIHKFSVVYIKLHILFKY